MTAAEMTVNDPIRLLVVEDDDTDLEWLTVMLRNATTCSFTTHEVSTIADAEAALALQGFDCVLLDLSLPDSDGLDTLDRALAADPLTPVVVFTRTDDLSVGMAAIHNGAQEYLVKGQATGNQILKAALFSVARAKATPPVVTEAPAQGLAAVQIGGLRAPWVCLDGRGAITAANKGFRHLVQAGESDLVGSAFDQYLKPEDFNGFKAGFDKLGRGSPGFVRPLVLIAPDATEVSTVASVTTLSTPDGVQVFVLVIPRLTG